MPGSESIKHVRIPGLIANRPLDVGGALSFAALGASMVAALGTTGVRGLTL